MVYLELNKWYLTRDKNLVQIISIDPDTHVLDPFLGSNDCTYYPTGAYSHTCESKRDLVREVSNIDTLLEIICEEGFGYIIDGRFEGVIIKIHDSSYRVVITDHCRYNDLFQTLLTAYKRFRGW